MMFNKPRYIKSPNIVGKPSESLRFKNKLNKNLNNSAYESIRNIVEEGENIIQLPQEKNSIDLKNVKPHKKYIIIKSK